MIKLYRCDIGNGECDSDAGMRLIRLAAKELCGAENPEILRTDKGKPYFKELPLKFSVSHSHKKAILAVSDREIGADIQYMKPALPRIAKRFFTPAECEYVGEDKVRFYEVWTKKEAYGKWNGGGFGAARNVDVTELSFYTETDGEYFISIYE